MFRARHKDNIKVQERSDPTSTISITSATLNTVCRDSIYLLYRLMFRSDHKDNIKVKERSDCPRPPSQEKINVSIGLMLRFDVKV